MTIAPIHPTLVSDQGSEGDVCFLHGFGADAYAWAMTAPALAERFRIWTVELPGHGANAGHPARDPGAMAQAIWAGLDEHAQAPLRLVGHSLGGAVALDIARAHPEHVSRMALIAPLGLGAGINEQFLLAYPELQDAEAAEDVLRLLVERPRLVSRQMVDHVLSALKNPTYRDGLREIAASILAMETPALPNGQDMTVIWGENDRVNPLDQIRLAQAGIDAHVLPATGHMPQIEAVRKTNEILLEALS